MRFEGDVAAFEAACLRDIRESLERCDRAEYECSPFRTLVAVELEGTFPDTAIVVKYRYKPRYDPKQEELRATFPIWSEELPLFKPFAQSSDVMWSEAGEQEVFLWFIEPDGPDKGLLPDREARRARPPTEGAPRRAPSCSPSRVAARPHASGLRARQADWRVLGLPAKPHFAELLIDCEEDRVLQAVLVGMLREA